MQSRHLFEIGDEVEVDSQSVYLTKELSEEYNEEHLASLLASHDVFDSKPEGQSVSGEFSIKFDDETTMHFKKHAGERLREIAALIGDAEYIFLPVTNESIVGPKRRAIPFSKNWQVNKTIRYLKKAGLTENISSGFSIKS